MAILRIVPCFVHVELQKCLFCRKTQNWILSVLRSIQHARFYLKRYLLYFKLFKPSTGQNFVFFTNHGSIFKNVKYQFFCKFLHGIKRWGYHSKRISRQSKLDFYWYTKCMDRLRTSREKCISHQISEPLECFLEGDAKQRILTFCGTKIYGHAESFMHKNVKDNDKMATTKSKRFVTRPFSLHLMLCSQLFSFSPTCSLLFVTVRHCSLQFRTVFF